VAEIYVSTDVETDGPIPGPHSMLSLGSAAFLADRTLLSTFDVNLQPLPGASAHPRTLQWWREHAEAWDACHTDARPPGEAMRSYVEWLQGLKGDLVFVAYPASFDFMFVYWYLMTFVGYSPFLHSALDIRSYAMAVLRTEWRRTSKGYMPRGWFSGAPHTHRALGDAIEQGELFCNILAAQLNGQSVERMASPAPSEEDEYEGVVNKAY
jgi:hypothetical protein